MGLRRLNRQKFGHDARGLPVGHHAAQPGRQLGQFSSRPVRADLLQRRESDGEARMAIPTQHPAGIANLHRSEDGPDAAGRVVLDRPKHAAVGTDPTKERVRVGLLAHDRGLKGRHDLLAVIDRQADLPIEQAVPTLVDPDLMATNLSKSVRAFNRDFPFHRCRCRHRRLLNQRRWRSADQLTIRNRPQRSYRSRQERRGPRGANKNRAAADARRLASIAHLGLPSDFASEMPRAPHGRAAGSRNRSIFAKYD